MNSLFCSHYKTTSHWQADIHPSLGKQSSIKMKLREDKSDNSGCCVPSSFPADLLLSMLPYGMEWPFSK